MMVSLSQWRQSSFTSDAILLSQIPARSTLAVSCPLHDVSVPNIKRVTGYTSFLGSINTGGAGASEKILTMRNWFQVVRSNAQGCSAQVVQLHASGDWPDKKTVRGAVSQLRPSHTVSHVVDRPLPNPAISRVGSHQPKEVRHDHGARLRHGVSLATVGV